jgi:Predicted membrane protein
VVETAFLASATAIIFLINFYFPLPFVRLLYPLPTVLVYWRWGGRSAWMAAIVTALLLTILMGPTRSLQYLIPHGLQGVLLGYLWRRGVSWFVSVPIGTMLGSLGTTFQLVLVSVLLGENVWLYSIIQASSFLNWLLPQWGILDQPDLIAIQALAIAGIIGGNFIYLLLVHIGAWLLFDRLQISIPAPPQWLETLLQ